MNANKPDMQQIQQYLNGELDAKAMHQLERQAQDDPFLMDALEGYQIVGGDQQPKIAELKARLAVQSRRHNKGGVVLWRVLPFAATLLIAITIGWLWLSPKQNKSTPVNKVVLIPGSPSFKPAPVEKPETAARAAAVTPPVIKRKLTVAESTILAAHRQHYNQLNMVTTRITHKKDTGAFKANNGKLYEHNYANQVPEQDVLRYKNKTPTQVTIHGSTIKGIVTDTTGHILAGVKIAIEGTRQTAVTDSIGAFQIVSLVPQPVLDVVYPGYNSKQVTPTGNPGLTIILNERTNVLAAVSVPGYVDDTTKTTRPLSSWKAFKEYIRKKAFMPGGETGTVKLAFVIDGGGKINGIRVLRGKNDAMNQKAIGLIMNAPEWKGAMAGKEMRLKIRFRRGKAV